jgi:hypothetical protein
VYILPSKPTENGLNLSITVFIIHSLSPIWALKWQFITDSFLFGGVILAYLPLQPASAGTLLDYLGTESRSFEGSRGLGRGVIVPQDAQAPTKK